MVSILPNDKVSFFGVVACINQVKVVTLQVPLAVRGDGAGKRGRPIMYS